MNDYFKCEVSESSLRLKHTSGFFSCCSIAVYNIGVFINSNSKLPVVNFSDTFSSYIGKNQTNGCDVYESCFNTPSSDGLDILFDKKITFQARSLFPYVAENYEDVKFIVSNWFSPNRDVLNIKDYLTLKYQINTNRTLCVCFRGTDKYKDIVETSYERFCSRVNELMHLGGMESVLIQTDQQQFIDYFRCKYPMYRVISIEENPRRTDKKQVAFQLEINQRTESARTFLATMLIMAECKYIISHTGNVARWINLYRGNSRNTVQYMAEREIIDLCNL